jgi:ABC-2 type transport system ATP-binding protein
MIASHVPGDAPVIEIADLSRRFGKTQALRNVALDIPRGSVFGLLGANGAGKTTLIKHILGLLRAQSGQVHVFGEDPVAAPKQVLAQIGYLAEDNDLPEWMSVAELLTYSRAFYPTWDDDYAVDLLRAFALNPGAKVRTLSKGQKARAGLIVALAYRPPLLVFDEPSSGLDPVVRHDILEAIIRAIADEGRTVLFSSHLLNEVERVADRVALIDKGRLLYSAELNEVKANHCAVTVRFEERRAQQPELSCVLNWQGGGAEWTAMCRGRRTAVKARLEELGACVVEEHTPSLNDIFLAQVGFENRSREEVPA